MFGEERVSKIKVHPDFDRFSESFELSEWPCSRYSSKAKQLWVGRQYGELIKNWSYRKSCQSSLYCGRGSRKRDTLLSCNPLTGTQNMLSPAHSFRLQPQDLPVLSVENETPVLRNFVFELGCFVFEFRQCFGIRFLWVSFLLLPGSTPDMNSRRGWEKIDKQDFLIIVKIKTLGELCILMCGRFPSEGLCVLQMRAHISVVFN